jgi:HSP20 family molecular chaperone IbpA
MQNGYLDYDLNIFYNQPNNNSNIQITENHLRFNKYLYVITKMDNSNTNLDNDLTNLASAGITMVDTFFKSVAPIAKNFSEKMTELDKIIKTSDNVSSNAAHATNTTESSVPDTASVNKPISYFEHEDETALYFVLDLPRVNKESCRIDINNNMLTVIANTDNPPQNFAFLPNNTVEVAIPLKFAVTKNEITARNINGALYITINKNINNNININILD